MQNKNVNWRVGNRIMNRKAEVSETMTWMVATVIIIVLIFLFLFAVNILSKSRGLEGLSGMFSSSDGNSLNANQEMLFALMESKINGKSVKEIIISGEYNGLRENIDNVLVGFANSGVECDFSVSGDGGFRISKGGKGEEAKLDLVGREVLLRC